jgi:chromosome segregation ATPase
MSGTYKFLQLASAHGDSKRRHSAAAALRRAAALTHEPQLSILATSVELDAFTRVKKAIDDMIATLKQQQADEVKKNDWCKSELQKNEMTTAKTEDRKADLQAKSAELESNIETLKQGIDDAKAQNAQMQVDLQRASEDRVKENLDFQKTVADQTATIEVLHKALDKLATFYDKESLVQASRQTPPVPQMEYKPSAGASGVMQMIEKLIYEAKALTAESRKTEGEAQAGYESVVADTNNAVAALQKEVITKTKDKAQATKENQETGDDIADTSAELEDLNKYNAELHGDCDYLLHNFMARQEARSQEMEALQQAKQILNGANLS